jgi:DNA-binding XRE family transcriptional regulator
LASLRTPSRSPPKSSTPATSDAPLTPEQVKAPRELLGWTRMRLAFRVGVSEKAVGAFESGEPWSRPLDLGLVRERLESAGVIFVEENGEGPGVRLRKAAK